MRYPNTIDKNIYLAYIRKENLFKDGEQILDAINLNWDLNFPESLVEICIKTIAQNWSSKYELLGICFLIVKLVCGLLVSRLCQVVFTS